jgi:hypothetical protein
VHAPTYSNFFSVDWIDSVHVGGTRSPYSTVVLVLLVVLAPRAIIYAEIGDGNFIKIHVL